MKDLQPSSAKHSKKQRLIILSILFFTVYSDQNSKIIAKSYLENQDSISKASGTIVFSYVENSAGFLGVLTGFPEYLQFFLLNICVGLILIYCLYYLFFRKHNSLPRAFSLAVVIGGGTSNLIDRIINDGLVIDFLQLGIGTFKTGIFNLADIYILSGSFIFGFIILSSDS